jgi:sensor histidine kinase regulating citrate/malate metabolism
VTRRLSLAGQLLALQVVIICVVLVGVAAVTVAQSTKRAQEFESRRALAAAETLANAQAFREAVEEEELSYVRVAAESNRSVIGSASVVVARADRTVLATADPDQLGARFDVGDSTVLAGRSWVGEQPFEGRPAAVGMAPVLSRSGEFLGFVAVQRLYPSVLDGLAAAAPNLLTYLGVASAVGIGGSLLVARRVKRQTLGMEPAEITGLVVHPDARQPGNWASRATRSAEPSPTSVSVRRCATRSCPATRNATGPWRAAAGCSWSTDCPSPAGAARSGRSPRCATGPNCWSCARSSTSPGT